MQTKDAEFFGNMVGENGADFVPYGSDWRYPLPYDGRRLTQAMETILSQSDPICLGYKLRQEPDKSKLYIYFEAIDLSGATSLGQDTSVVGFLLFRYENDYELVVIGPVPKRELDRTLGGLQPCIGSNDLPSP